MFEEELGFTPVLKRSEVDESDLPTPLQSLLPLVKTTANRVAQNVPDPTRDAGTFTIILDGTPYSFQTWDTPSEIQDLVTWLRQRAKPVGYI